MANTSVTSTTPIPESTTINEFLKRLTEFEADVVTGIIGGLIFLISLLLALWAWTKRKAEKRHLDHKIHGEEDKSISVTSDVVEAYTVNPLVQNMLLHKNSPLMVTPSPTVDTTESASPPGTKQSDSSGEKAAKEAPTEPLRRGSSSCDPQNLARV